MLLSRNLTGSAVLRLLMGLVVLNEEGCKEGDVHGLHDRCLVKWGLEWRHASTNM